MTISRRQFTWIAAAGTGVVAAAWQTACTEVSETGEVTAATVRTLLDAQGPRGIYENTDELERLRTAVGNMIRVQEELRNFPLSEDEQPLTVFWRG